MPQQLGIDTRSQTDEQTHTHTKHYFMLGKECLKLWNAHKHTHTHNKKSIKNINVSQDFYVQVSDISG